MEHGNLVASTLAGSWRHKPPPLQLRPAELPEVIPLLLAAGAAGLGWWRVRGSELSRSLDAFQLRQGYRLHTLQAALHERELARVLTALRAAGIDPLLAKGWAEARLYAEPGLRPYG